jgi:acetyltransferase-like isoleucine patch superfamily enzyme
MGSQVALHAVERVALGAHATIGERASVFDSDHRHDGSEAPVVDQPVAVAPVTIGANSFVGANSLVLRGAAIAGGVALLVSRMRDRSDDDGDDGAVV